MNKIDVYCNGRLVEPVFPKKEDIKIETKECKFHSKINYNRDTLLNSFKTDDGNICLEFSGFKSFEISKSQAKKVIKSILKLL